MDALDPQDRMFLERQPEYLLHLKLLELEQKMIALLLANDPLERALLPFS